MSIPLTLTCNDYEWLQPVIHGDVEPENVNLTVFSDVASVDQHSRMIAGEFDVAEFSLGTYITGWPQGWEFTAIPVFPRRFFPHSRVFVNRNTSINKPTDLEGKRVGIISFQNTLALWFIGMFVDQYGLDPTRVDWQLYGTQQVPVSLSYEYDRIDRETLPAQLARGDVDAVVNPRTAPFYQSDDDIAPLFDDLPEVERDCFESTGFYPLMHTIVVRNDLLDEYPWLSTELAETFRRSHEVFSTRANEEALYPLVWWLHYREREAAVFGDVWERSMRLEPNLTELETMIQYACDRGLIDEPFAPEELFV